MDTLMTMCAFRRDRCIRRLLLLIVVVTAGACGGDGTGPDEEQGPNEQPGIEILAGANVSDTIGAQPMLALSVVLRDTAGRAIPNAVVRFTSVMLTAPGGTQAPSVLVGDLGSHQMSTFVADTTSADGQAGARIVMGDVAGAGGVTIGALTQGFEATANYTIIPGAATKVVLPIVDTTIQVGQSLPLGARVEDRARNARSDAPTYAVAGADVTVSGGQATASVPARAAVVARLGGTDIAPDTTWVSVVPQATIATRKASLLFTAELDGTKLTDVPHNLDASEDPDWHPDGQSLITTLGSSSNPYLLYRVELTGALDKLVEAAASNGQVRGFTYSPNGEWVYISSNNCNYNAILYRFRVAQPAAVERLSPSLGGTTKECFELVNHWPSLSPDGTRLTYENQTGNRSGYSVRVMTIASRAITQLVVDGQRPRWSPGGDWIAYWADQQIWVVKPDGTDARRVSPTGRWYVPGVQWSPDGQWILARFRPRAGWAGTTVSLLNVDTRLEIPLAWTTGYSTLGLPAWRPRSGS